MAGKFEELNGYKILSPADKNRAKEVAAGIDDNFLKLLEDLAAIQTLGSKGVVFGKILVSNGSGGWDLVDIPTSSDGGTAFNVPLEKDEPYNAAGNIQGPQSLQFSGLSPDLHFPVGQIYGAYILVPSTTTFAGYRLQLWSGLGSGGGGTGGEGQAGPGTPFPVGAKLTFAVYEVGVRGRFSEPIADTIVEVDDTYLSGTKEIILSPTQGAAKSFTLDQGIYMIAVTANFALLPAFYSGAPGVYPGLILGFTDGGPAIQATQSEGCVEFLQIPLDNDVITIIGTFSQNQGDEQVTFWFTEDGLNPPQNYFRLITIIIAGLTSEEIMAAFIDAINNPFFPGSQATGFIRVRDEGTQQSPDPSQIAGTTFTIPDGVESTTRVFEFVETLGDEQPGNVGVEMDVGPAPGTQATITLGQVVVSPPETPANPSNGDTITVPVGGGNPDVVFEFQDNLANVSPGNVGILIRPQLIDTFLQMEEVLQITLQPFGINIGGGPVQYQLSLFVDFGAAISGFLTVDQGTTPPAGSAITVTGWSSLSAGDVVDLVGTLRNLHDAINAENLADANWNISSNDDNLGGFLGVNQIDLTNDSVGQAGNQQIQQTVSFQFYESSGLFNGQDEGPYPLSVTAVDDSGVNPKTAITWDDAGQFGFVFLQNGNPTRYDIVFTQGVNFVASTEKQQHAIGWRVPNHNYGDPLPTDPDQIPVGTFQGGANFSPITSDRSCPHVQLVPAEDGAPLS